MNFNLYLEWSIFFMLIGFGLYTMKVIKNEKKQFLKEGVQIQFHHFQFLIPKWWTIVEQDRAQMIFKRTDTRYEWEAKLSLHVSSLTHSLEEIYKNEIEQRKIIFDLDTSVIYNPTDFNSLPIVQDGQYEMLRIKGTATQDRSERLYYDAFILRDKASGDYLYAESKSSVLNGLIEGPYFEEMMKTTNKIPIAEGTNPRS